MTRKPKLTRVEKLLEAARKRPSPTCPDRRQLDLIEYVSTREKLQAFACLDEAISEVLESEHA
jgi:hypothetical protein